MIRHTDTLTADSDNANPIQIELIGITNPNTEEAMTVKIWVMDSGSTTDQDEHVKEAYTASESFTGQPQLKLNLFKVVNENKNVRENSKYQFWFERTYDSEETPITLTNGKTKFMVFFPDDYVLSPASLGSSQTPDESAGACNLYEIDYMSGTYTSDDKVFEETAPACKYNYLHHYLGNVIEFTAPVKETVNDDAVDAKIQRYNDSSSDNDKDYLDYVFEVETKNPENGYLSKNFDDRYDMNNPQLWD